MECELKISDEGAELVVRQCFHIPGGPLLPSDIRVLSPHHPAVVRLEVGLHEILGELVARHIPRQIEQIASHQKREKPQSV